MEIRIKFIVFITFEPLPIWHLFSVTQPKISTASIVFLVGGFILFNPLHTTRNVLLKTLKWCLLIYWNGVMELSYSSFGSYNQNFFIRFPCCREAFGIQRCFIMISISGEILISNNLGGCFWKGFKCFPFQSISTKFYTTMKAEFLILGLGC